MAKIEDTAHGLKEQQQTLVKEMQAISQRVKTENRNLTREESEHLSQLDSEVEALAQRAETIEKLERVNKWTVEERKEQIISSPYHQGAKPFQSVEERSNGWKAWFGHNSKISTPELRRCAERCKIEVSDPSMQLDFIPWDRDGKTREQRNQMIGLSNRSSNGQTVGTESAGGYGVAIDQSFLAVIDYALKYFGNVMQYAHIYDTPTGAALPLTNSNDVSNEAETVGEGGSMNVLDQTIARQTLQAFKYDTIVKVSIPEAMQDVAFDWMSDVAYISGQRIGRKVNSDVWNGGGGNAITGILSSINVGYQSGNSAPSYDDLVAWIESLDFLYQDMPKTGMLFNQAFRLLLRQIVDGNSRPIIWSLVDSLQTGYGPTKKVLDYTYYITPNLPSWGHTGSGSGAVGNVPAIFGDLDAICFRRVRGSSATGGDAGLVITRLNEVYRTSGFVGFLTEARFDCLYRNSGNNPLVGLQSPA
jgi:HK97 family phage major capsid protein